MTILQILWIIIFGNISLALFNIMCSICMSYENWAYKLFGSKLMYVTYGLIYLIWFFIGCEFNLVPLGLS